MSEPVPAGEPVTIQPAEQQTAYEPQQEAEPPTGPGQQSVAESQAAGQQRDVDVEDPQPGPGAAVTGQEPAAVTPPDQAAASQGLSEEDAQLAPVSPATSNESPKLPPNLTSSAAKAHAMLGQAQEVGQDGEADPSGRLEQVLSIVQLALAELEKFLPDHVRAPAAVEGREAVDRL